MPTNPEAPRLNLEYYRKQAKALLKAAQSGDQSARSRMALQLGDLNPEVPKLHDAQLTIAREQGLPSWARFRKFIVDSGPGEGNLAAEFIDAATSNLRRAEEILSRSPQVAGGGYYVDLVLGAWKAIEAALADRPALAVGPSGPQNCDPLVYVCFSRFAGGKSSRADDLVETARILLRHGANPSTTVTPDDLPDNPLSCLYAATGLNNNAALARVLLVAGANPNDSESLYHSTEYRDLTCMKLLLQYGATPAGTKALNHMLDREDAEGVRLLLGAGADPNEVNDRGETALYWAVWRGRSAGIVTALLDHAADIDRKRHDGWTAYALAVQTGQQEIAALLESRGANRDLPVIVGNNERLLADLAMNHHVAAVRALLSAGAHVNARGDLGATALHWACWKGYADLVELLLDRGASLTIEDEEFHGTPAGWFAHGVNNCREGTGDYAAVAHLLIARGAAIPKVDLPTGSAAVDAVLRELGAL